MDSVTSQRAAGTAIGRGALYLTAGQSLLVLSGYVVNIGLGRHLGPIEFGRFASMASLIVLVEVFFLLGIPQALSKHVAETGGGNRRAVRWGGAIQLLCGGVLFSLLFGLAKPLALLLRDPGLVEHIRVVAWAVPAVAVFQFYTKILNGLAEFGRQAVAVAVFSILRLPLTLAFAFLNSGAQGALWALVLATALASLVAGVSCRAARRTCRAEWSLQRMAAFAVQFAVLTGAVKFLTTADQLFVKALLGEGSQAGLYGAAALFGKAPRIVAVALSGAAFPLIARSVALHNRDGAVRDLQEFVRRLAIVLMPCVVLATAAGRSLLAVLFGAHYAPAAGALGILMLGSTLLGLFGVLSSALTAVGRVRFAMVISLLMALLDSVLCPVLVPWLGIAGAAVAVAVTALVGCLAALRYITARLGSVVLPMSWAKIASSSAAVGALAYLLRDLPNLWLLSACAVLPGVYLAALVVLGEIRVADVRSMFVSLPLVRALIRG